ncbi:MAG: hypothetical protein ACP5UH_00855 [Candidatus Micrarchaeia archaeon]
MKRRIDMLSAGVYTIAVVLLSIMLSASGIMLGVGFAMGDKKLKELGQNELFQTLINGAVLGIIFVLFAQNGLVGSIINGMMTGLQINATCEQILASNPAICFASAYLAGTSTVTINGVAYQSLLSISTEMLLSVSAVYAAVALLSSIKLSFVVSISLASLFSPLLAQFGRLISMLTTAIIGIEAQAILLKFVAVSAVSIMLPVGMVLRIVYFTRKLGGALMAIAIGLFCVLPLTYVFNAALVSNYSADASNTAITSLTSLLNSTSQSASAGLQAYGTANSTNDTKGIIQGLSSIAKSLLDSMINIFRRISNLIALLIVEVFILPMLSIALTIIGIREFAKILGSEFVTSLHLGYL